MEATLCKKAVEMMAKAYAPYSGYRVGAALLTASGRIYTGCNVENAAYSPTVCAERVAFFKAISEGERSFTAIAVAGGTDAPAKDGFPPCGVCRQVMAEFCGPEFKILVARPDGFECYTLRDLLPEAFSPRNLEGRR